MCDGFMVAFQYAKKGLDCAIAIQRAFANHNATDGEHVKVRIGLHAGEAIKDGDEIPTYRTGKKSHHRGAQRPPPCRCGTSPPH